MKNCNLLGDKIQVLTGRELSSAVIAQLPQSKSILNFYLKVASLPAYAWIQEWWPQASTPTSIIVTAGGHSWQASGVQDNCPPNILEFGWCGSDVCNRLRWIGFDLDVGHGNECYEDSESAIAAAHKIREFFEGDAEIRFSKSGIGIHVRHKLPETEQRPGCDGPKLAKVIVRKLGIRACHTPLGRQTFWFWTAQPSPTAFNLIAAAEMRAS